MYTKHHPFEVGACQRGLFSALLAAVASFALPAWGALTVNSANGTVTDSTTSLVWDQCPYGLSGPACATGTAFSVDWPTALSKAKEANAASYKGFTDWRLPNKNELESIAKIDTYTSGQPSIDTTAFPATSPGQFWTSTTYARFPSEAWLVDFSGGWFLHSPKTNHISVRLVRSGQSYSSFDSLPVALPSDGTCVSVAASAFAPTTLCTSGSASSVSAAGGKWVWSCLGSNGGSTASCSAPTQSTPTGTGSGTAVVSGTNGWSIDATSSAGFIKVSGDPSGKSPAVAPPAGVRFPHGLFDFTLRAGSAGSAATVTINYPSALPRGAQYWKYGRTVSNPTAHWYVFSGAQFSSDRTSVTLTLVDGGEGDDDTTANGTITDPGGAGISPQPVDVRSYVPAVNGNAGYSFLRVINAGTLATAVTAAVIDAATGTVGAAKPLIASLPPGAAKTLLASDIETALGVSLAATDRPRIRIHSGISDLEVQSFLLQPTGVFNDATSAYSGTSIVVGSYFPAANVGQVSSLRVINTGSVPTAVTVARLDPVTGATGTAGTLATALPAGAAITYTAQQIETALGAALPAADRPRLLVKGVASSLDVQSLLNQTGGVITDMSSEQTGANVDVRTYVPAAQANYQSLIRVGNDYSNGISTWIMVSLLDETTGQVTASGILLKQMPPWAVRTFTSSEIEAALGVSIPANSRPRIRVSSVGYFSSNLHVQSYLVQPDGTYSEVSSAVTGPSNNVRTYVPATYANYTSFLRVINTGKAASAITVAYIDPDTGLVGTARTLLASLPAGAARTFSSAQVEAALGVSIAGTVRPMLQITGTSALEVQSFMQQPGGVFNEVSGTQ
jgi:hypothetical protein